MSALALSILIFALSLGGIAFGALLRKALPHHHLSKDAQDSIRLGVGLIGTMAALVLGLLIASAKGTYDTQSTQVRQITAQIIMLDSLLRQYGPETTPLRRDIRAAIGPFSDRIWQEKANRRNAPYEVSAASERIYLELQRLKPADDVQRALQARAAQVATDVASIRLQLFVGAGNSVPGPFLAILAFWLLVVFASFSLFSDMNATVLVALGLFALSAACAIFLVLELSEPFTGIMKIPEAPLRQALAPLAP